MPEDTLVYAFRDAHGNWLATLNREEAEHYAIALEQTSLKEMTLGELHNRDTRALVRARAQYYWAQDLLSGRARGAVI